MVRVIQKLICDIGPLVNYQHRQIYVYFVKATFLHNNVRTQVQGLVRTVTVEALTVWRQHEPTTRYRVVQ